MFSNLYSMLLKNCLTGIAKIQGYMRQANSIFVASWTPHLHVFSIYKKAVAEWSYDQKEPNLYLYNIKAWLSVQAQAFPGFNLTTRDTYCTIQLKVFTNQILAGNIYIANHIKWTQKIVVLKAGNTYQIRETIRQCYNFKRIFIDDYQPHPFLSFADIFYGAENSKLERWDH